MKSNNPVFSRSEEFNRASSNAYGNQTYAGGGQPYPGYGETGTDPSTWGTGTPGQVDGGRMTVDSVVQKTAISIALVFVTAFATWWWIGDIIDANAINEEAWGRALTLSMAGAGAAFLLSLVNSFKKVISPALVLAFAAAEGVALGVAPHLGPLHADRVEQLLAGVLAHRPPGRPLTTRDSQAQSAGSIPVARSTTNPQVTDPGVVCCPQPPPRACAPASRPTRRQLPSPR